MTSAIEPPVLVLVWCPKCGRDDRYSKLNLPPRRHYIRGGMCDGVPVRVRYEPVRQQPLREIGDA